MYPNIYTLQVDQSAHDTDGHRQRGEPQPAPELPGAQHLCAGTHAVPADGAVLDPGPRRLRAIVNTCGWCLLRCGWFGVVRWRAAGGRPGCRWGRAHSPIRYLVVTTGITSWSSRSWRATGWSQCGHVPPMSTRRAEIGPGGERLSSRRPSWQP